MEMERFSHLPELEQLGHIASEISRARGWAERANISRRDMAVGQALELIGQALSSPVPFSLVSRDELVSWKARLLAVSTDEGLLQDIETRLMKILTGAQEHRNV